MSGERPEWFKKLTDRIWNDYILMTLEPPEELKKEGVIALEKEKFLVATGLEIKSDGYDEDSNAFFLMSAYNLHEDGNIRIRGPSNVDSIVNLLSAQKEGKDYRVPRINLMSTLALIIINPKDSEE